MNTVMRITAFQRINIKIVTYFSSRQNRSRLRHNNLSFQCFLLHIGKKRKALYIIDIQGFCFVLQFIHHLLEVLPVAPQGLEPWTPTLRVSCSTS